MKRRTIIILLLLVAAGSAVGLYLSRRQNQATSVLTTAPAHYGFIARSVTATGNIQPVDTVIVGAQVSGVVKAVYADYNSTVKQGQLLAKVDPSIINAQIDEARANLRNAESNLRYQQQTYDRQKQLYTLGAISKADMQLAENQFRSAQASVGNASAQVRLSERNLFYTNIYSPINGVVLNKNISAGQTIASSFSAPTLFVLAKDLSKILVNADVDEADIGEVKPGQNVTFTVDAFPDDVFKGTVQKIYLHPSVSANVVTYPTLIVFDNRELKLLPGMTANISINVQEDSNALLIPAKALSFRPDSALLKGYVIRTPEGPTRGAHQSKTARSPEAGQITRTQDANSSSQVSWVWIKNGDTLAARKIRVGINDGTNVQVLKGLSGAEEIVTGIRPNSEPPPDEQRSPFLPQTRRRPTGGQGTRGQ